MPPFAVVGCNVLNLPNHLCLQASIAEIGSLRHTPAGIAAINLVLEHHSEIANEMGLQAGSKWAGNAAQNSCGSQLRQVNLVIKAVAFGKLAEQAAALPLLASPKADASTEAVAPAMALFQFSGYLTNVRGGKAVVFQLQEIRSQ